jgi:alpha-L-fucosidase 2
MRVDETEGISRRALLGGALVGVAVATLPVTADAEEAAEATTDLLHNRMRTDQEWADFLSRQDLLWRRMPRSWYEGPFLGNGFLATQVYREPGANALRFTIDHSEVQDHRPEFGNEWGVARLPVGRLLLTPVGQITGVDLRLDLWNAELRGTVVTDRGELSIRVFIHAEKSLLLLDVRPTSGERDFSLEFHPLEALSPRTIREDPPKTFVRNPAPTTRTEGEVVLVAQAMVAGGQTVTAHHKRKSWARTDFLLSVRHSFPDLGAGRAALDIVRAAAAMPSEVARLRHRDWWHRFYRKSFLSIPDGLLQSFYWIQLYKLASAARAEAPVMATTGPWIEPTPWPSVWWNLNAQLEYWPAYGSNHLELDPIPRTISQNQKILIDALRPEFREDSMGLRRSTDAKFDDAGFVGAPTYPSPDPEIGDLPWLLHNAWLTYRHSMDERILCDTVFPVLRRAVNYYLHFLHKGNDGRLHLQPTFSPEYGTAPDCNFDLALIRWSCRTLIDSAKLLRIDDPLAGRWREVLDQLVDYPVDVNGFMIGTGVPFAKSHRHYSHLLAVYPLYLVNWEQPENRDLIERSLRHWISFEGALRGYSFTGASSISAQMNRGDDALAYLREFVARFAQPNTMYYEAGPVIETPLSGAQSLHDMLCQSWGATIRIFPAVPSTWADVTLHDFRTEGAFLVSAVRKGGTTRFVRVRSEAGAPCRLKPGIAGPLKVRGNRGRPRWRDLGGGVIEIELRRGEEAVVYQAGTRPDLTIAPVAVTTPGKSWGLPALPSGGATVPVDISALFDNDGLSNEFSGTDGNFDGAGNTYPAAQLPLTGGVADDNVPFEFTNGDEGSKNNLIASGQVVAMPAGKYRKAHLLGAADTADVDAMGVATYADGTTSSIRIALTSWKTGPNFGESEAVSTREMHTPTGPKPVKLVIFHQVVDLDPVRELTSITLPTKTTGARQHLFGITLERTQ